MGKGNGTHGTIAYNRGMMISFLTVEANSYRLRSLETVNT
ncbi:hypothetical protein OURE66S_04226 [Oligella ureolytica]